MNDDMEKEPQDYVKCALVLGATSSTSRSNYVLRRTAVEDGEAPGEVAASTIHRSFYLGDLLKSMKDLNSTRKLVKDVINMRKPDSFHLTKFISNNMKLLLSVSQHERKLRIKTKKLSGDL